MCKAWCNVDFNSGKSDKDILCSYSNCAGCTFDNEACPGRRARWVQSCEQMNAIECMKAIIDGQCKLYDKACVSSNSVAEILDSYSRVPIYDDEGLPTFTFM